MKKPRYSDSQISAILRESEAGTPVTDLCREHGTSTASFYQWCGSKSLRTRIAA